MGPFGHLKVLDLSPTRIGAQISQLFADERWQGAPLFDEADKRFEFWVHMLEAAKKTLAEWEQIFEDDHDAFAEQFRYGPVALEHPQLVHDSMVVDVEDAALRGRGVVA